MGTYAQELLSQGREEGKVEGRAEMLIEMLGHRLGPVPEAVKMCISASVASEPEVWLDTVINAKSYADVLTERGLD